MLTPLKSPAVIKKFPVAKNLSVSSNCVIGEMALFLKQIMLFIISG